MFQLSDSAVRTAILSDLLQALESQLTDSPSTRMVAIATELSMLYMILLKKWARLVYVNVMSIPGLHPPYLHTECDQILEVVKDHTHCTVNVPAKKAFVT